MIGFKKKSRQIASSALAIGLTLGTMAFNGIEVKAATNFNYGDAFQKALMFYEFQKSGDLPDNQRNNWRGDSGLKDGADVGLDLTGGWYDAGDHVKFNLPMSYTSTMLAWSYIEDTDVYKASGQDKYMLDEIRWANDYFMKCHPSANEYYYQVGNGGLDHAFWGSAEIIQMERPAYKVDLNNPGSAVCAETAASLAAASIAFKDIDPAYAATCLKHAKELFAFAETTKSDAGYQKQAAGYYTSSSFYDDLSWASMWIYLATDDATYLQKAKDFSQNWGKLNQTNEIDYKWTQCWDDVHYGAAMLLAKYDPTSSAATYKKEVEKNLDYWTVGINGNKVSYTPKGLAYLDAWGSLRYATTTAFLASIYVDWDGADQSKVATYEKFAKSQADYALGSTGHSYVIGVGENSSRNSHHRTAHGTWDNNLNGALKEARHILVGALVGGPGSNDDYADVITDYQKNEVACDYNAGFTGLMAKMYDDYGGTIDSSLNAIEEVGEEVFLEAGINAQDKQNAINFIEIKAVVYNRSAWPARVTDKLTYRYFVDIRDVLAAGYKASDMKITANYSQHGAKISSLQPWDEQNGIYYVEIDLSGAKIYPGGQSEHKSELQFRIAAPGKWDYTKSPSFVDIASSSSNSLAKANHFALYDNGKLVFGQEPSGATKVYAPTASIASPVAGTIFKDVTEANPVVIKANAEVQESTISKVEFFVDGTKIGESTKAPYEMNFVPSDYSIVAGTTKDYSLTVKVAAANGKSTTSEAVKVSVVLPVLAAPTVAVTAPIDGTSIDMSKGITAITMNATAEIEKSTIQKVVFYVNGKVVGESKVAPYTASYLPTGSASQLGELSEYTITAEAIAANGTKTISKPVNVSVQLPVVAAPEVEIVSPVNEETFAEVTKQIEVSVAADVLEDDIKLVEFYADGKKFAESTSAVNGVYTATYVTEDTVTEMSQLTPISFTAKATSTKGKTTTSAAVKVYVQLEVVEAPVVDFVLEVGNTGNGQASTNTLTNNFKLVHKSGNDIDLSKLEIRYYFTADGSEGQTVWCDNAAAQMNKAPWYSPYTSKVSGKVIKMDAAKAGADCYIQITINASEMISAGTTLEIATRTAKSNWSNYDQSNDYSYGNAGKVCVYYDGNLVAGIEP